MKYLFLTIPLFLKTFFSNAQHITLKGMTCIISTQVSLEAHLHPLHSLQMNFRYLKTPQVFDNRYIIKAWMPEYRYYIFNFKERKHNFFTSAYARFARYSEPEAGSNSFSGYSTRKEKGGGIMVGYRHKNEDKVVFEVFAGLHRIKGEYYFDLRRINTQYQENKPRIGFLVGYDF